MRGDFHARRRAVVLAAVGLIVAAGTAEANVPLTGVSSDPFTNPTSQHATEVRARHLRVRLDHRRGLPGWPVLRRRRLRHRLRPLHGRRRDVDPTGFLPGLTFSAGERLARTSASATRASPTTPATRLADLLDPDPARPASCRPSSSAARPTAAYAGQPGSSRRPGNRPTSTRTGRCATTIRPARSTATATPSSTTSARAISNS